jgi:hypothetical protein
MAKAVSVIPSMTRQQPLLLQLGPTSTANGPAWEDINFNTDLSASLAAGKIQSVTVSLSGTNFDANGARAFTVSGSGIVDFYPAFTTVSGNSVIFAFLVLESAEMHWSLITSNQPTIASGDFEAQQPQRALALQVYTPTLVFQK